MHIIIIAGSTLIGKAVGQGLLDQLSHNTDVVSLLSSTSEYMRLDPGPLAGEQVLVIDLGGKLDRTEVFVRELNADLILNLQPYYLKSQMANLNLKKRFGDKLKVILTSVQDWISPVSSVDTSNQQLIFEAGATTKAMLNGIKLIRYIGTIPTITAQKTATQSLLTAYAYEDRDDYDWCFVDDALKSYTVRLVVDPTFQELYIPNYLNKHPNLVVYKPNTLEEACESIMSSKGLIHLPTLSNRAMTAGSLTVLLAAKLGVPSFLHTESHLLQMRKSIAAARTAENYRRNWAELMTGLTDATTLLAAQQKTLTCENYPGLFVTDNINENSLSAIVLSVVKDMVEPKLVSSK